MAVIEVDMPVNILAAPHIYLVTLKKISHKKTKKPQIFRLKAFWLTVAEGEIYHIPLNKYYSDKCPFSSRFSLLNIIIQP